MLIKVFAVAAVAAVSIAGFFLWHVSDFNAPVKIQETALLPAEIQTEENIEEEVIAESLEIPWDIAFLPDGTLLATQRKGELLHIESQKAYPVDGVAHVGEGGLLGIALHPDFDSNKYLYLYQTTRTSSGLQNRVIRYVYDVEALVFDMVVIDGIPGASNHDGGRIEFGPDGFLYVTTGDAGVEISAQSTDDLAGSILRVHDDGSIPNDNPFGNAVYSYGHRNPQGIAWDAEGRLWITEHGRSGLGSGYDEINLVQKGGNYGWPQSEGDVVEENTIAPAMHSTASDTWAPASALYFKGSLFFGGLRGRALYEAVLDGEKVVSLKEHLKDEYGRMRSVRLGPDGFFYLTTSNTDGRGDHAPSDDKIIRIDPSLLQ